MRFWSHFPVWFEDLNSYRNAIPHKNYKNKVDGPEKAYQSIILEGVVVIEKE